MLTHTRVPFSTEEDGTVKVVPLPERSTSRAGFGGNMYLEKDTISNVVRLDYRSLKSANKNR